MGQFRGLQSWSSDDELGRNVLFLTVLFFLNDAMLALHDTQSGCFIVITTPCVITLYRSENMRTYENTIEGQGISALIGEAKPMDPGLSMVSYGGVESLDAAVLSIAARGSIPSV
jgi:hypothetical protein